MNLSYSQLAELSELRERAYGRPVDGAFDENSRKRLFELEELLGGAGKAQLVKPSIDEPEVIRHPEETSPDENGDGSPQAVPRPIPRWAVALLSVGAGIGLGIFAGIQAADLSPLPAPMNSNPEFSSSETWDTDSIQYVGTFRTANFWIATRDEGRNTCLVVEDPTDGVILSNETCASSDIAAESGLKVGSISPPENGSGDAASIVRLFSVSFSGRDATLSIVEKATTDPESVLRTGVEVG